MVFPSCSLSDTKVKELCQVSTFHSSEQATFEIKGNDAVRLSGYTESEVVMKEAQGRSEDALITLPTQNNISVAAQTNGIPGKPVIVRDGLDMSVYYYQQIKQRVTQQRASLSL